MRIPSFAKPTAADQPEVPKEHQWFHDAMGARDDQLVALTRAVSGRLDRSANLNDEIREISLRHNTEVELTLQRLAGAPIGVLVLWNSAYDYTRLKWQRKTDKTIQLKVYLDSEPSGLVVVRLLIMGGG